MEYFQFNIALEINFAFVLSIGILLLFLIPNNKMEHGLKQLFLSLIALAVIDAVAYNIELICRNYPYPTFTRLFCSYITYCTKMCWVYILCQLFLRKSNKTMVKRLLFIPIVVGMLIEATIFFSPIVYSYSSTNEFIQGPLYAVPNIIGIAYILIPVILAIRGVIDEKWEFITLLVMLAVIIFTIIYEVVYQPDYSIRETTTGFCILTYYMYFRSQMHMDELDKKEEERIKSEEQMLKSLINKTVSTLSYAVDAKDSYTNGHSARVADYAKRLAIAAGKTEQEVLIIHYAGLLHDVGKIAIPEAIITKPTKLTDEEFEIIKTHPVEGAKILADVDIMPELKDAAKYHHERIDGKGYPEGLKGDEIPEIARVIAVADAYDAMTSKRSYRDALPQEAAKAELIRVKGTQLDSYYTDLMLELIDNDINYDMREK